MDFWLCTVRSKKGAEGVSIGLRCKKLLTMKSQEYIKTKYLNVWATHLIPILQLLQATGPDMPA
jgi:hypothetical protein